MYFLTNDISLLIFKYNFLHRNTITNRNLHLWDITRNSANPRSENCSFCNNFPETIEHLFYDCLQSKTLWDNIFNWISRCNGINISFSRAEILLGGAPSVLNIFNLIFIIVLKYIYSCRCQEKPLNFFVIKYIIKNTYEIEKLLATESNKLGQFLHKWDLIINCFS